MAAESAQTPNNVEVDPKFYIEALERKFQECDRSNTMLLALVNQQASEIKDLREAIDALADQKAAPAPKSPKKRKS